MKFTGFANPSEQFAEKRLDLNVLLIQHPAATFLLRVKGEDNKDIGIGSGDILVVDRSIQPKDNALVVAAVEGVLRLSRVREKNGRLLLAIGGEARLVGVVTAVIHFPR
ncbi:MAG: LexA family transcriptional regulator [Candidatus Atribacteria bacterium]|mgnify:CR=1 FL=1|nr:LexA family transcriptional regulator [Candidatus Atribacteria bacterium]